MSSMLGELGAEVREEDLIREVAIFAEKSDIAEEVSRLHGHLDQFKELISVESCVSNRKNAGLHYPGNAQGSEHDGQQVP